MNYRGKMIDDWFPAKVTDTDTVGGVDVYAFAEYAVHGDYALAEKVGGRVGTLLNPAVAVSGGPFVAGDLILVRTAKTAGGLLWECVPIGQQPPDASMLLVEVTAYSAGTKYHTVKRKTWSGGAVADYSPATSYTTCRASARTIQGGTNYQIPNGTLCYLDPIPDVAGDYWIEPTGDYATASTPGVVSSYDQVKQGNWTVTRTGSTTLGNGATLTAGTSSDTWGVVQSKATHGVIQTGDGGVAVNWIMSNDYDPIAGGVVASSPRLCTTSLTAQIRLNDTTLGDNYLIFRTPGNVSGISGDVSGNLTAAVPDTKSLILAPSPFGGGEVVQYAIKDSAAVIRSGIWADRSWVDRNGFSHAVTVSGGIITAWTVSFVGPTRVSSNSALAAGEDTYADNGASRVTLTLPATAAEGEQFKVIGAAAGGWQVGQNAGQTIYQGASATTTGTGGHLRGGQWTVVVLECVNADTDFVVVSANATLTFT